MGLKFREIYWINDNKRYSDIDEIFIYEKMKNYKGPIVNINYFVKEMFGIDQHIDSLEVIKEDKSDIKTNSECQSSKSNAMEVDEVASVENEENEMTIRNFSKR